MQYPVFLRQVTEAVKEFTNFISCYGRPQPESEVVHCCKKKLFVSPLSRIAQTRTKEHNNSDV